MNYYNVLSKMVRKYGKIKVVEPWFLFLMSIEFIGKEGTYEKTNDDSI